ncbi:hypothetical protein CFC21_069926 [Triticum aestivum]|uniref:Bidirectional sugar transporter SWEET n=2 Tax=Triticum aestivum TaxID=4565 RepID=A0A3B6LEH7_WHEAT|nr:uncharacterized protein LOC123115636 [Triticum aestivum]KAF7063405.1 hypothetical protein CFC21_069926 [Triticum aestivum]
MAQGWAERMAKGWADASHLDVFCWGTAWISPLFSLWATCISWRHRALGGGGRRPEPTIAALMGSLAWLAYGLEVIDDTVEPLSVNAWGATFQAVYLVTFLFLCTGEERRRAIRPMVTAGIYVALLLTIGGVDSGSFKLLCSIAGSVSAAAPLFTYWFLDQATLPPWGMSAFSIVHCFAWCIRGVTKPVPQHEDLYMATQNGIGAFCSLVLVFLAWFLPGALAPPMEEDMDLLAALINPDVVEVEHPLLPGALAPPVEEDMDLLAALVNPDVVELEHPLLPGALAPPMEEDMDLLAALVNPDVVEVEHPLFPAPPPPPRRRSTGADVDAHHDPPPPRRRST